MAEKTRSMWLSASWRQEHGQTLRALVYHYGWFDWRWKVDTRFHGRDGLSSWHRKRWGRSWFRGRAIREARRAFEGERDGE